MPIYKKKTFWNAKCWCKLQNISSLSLVIQKSIKAIDYDVFVKISANLQTKAFWNAKCWCKLPKISSLSLVIQKSIKAIDYAIFVKTGSNLQKKHFEMLNVLLQLLNLVQH